MKRHLFYVLMDRTSPIHECEKCLNTNDKSVLELQLVRSEGCTSCTPVLQALIFLTIRLQKPRNRNGFWVFFLPCTPLLGTGSEITDHCDVAIPVISCYHKYRKQFDKLEFGGMPCGVTQCYRKIPTAFCAVGMTLYDWKITC